MTSYGANTVAILGGNSLFNRILAVLLQGAGYDTRLLEEDSAVGKEDLFEDVDLLLLAPTLSDGFRKTFVTSMRSVPETASIPVLTLSTSLPQTTAGDPTVVPWPSRIEDLKRMIDDVLRSGTANEAGPANEKIVDEVLVVSDTRKVTTEGSLSENFRVDRIRRHFAL